MLLAYKNNELLTPFSSLKPLKQHLLYEYSFEFKGLAGH